MSIWNFEKKPGNVTQGGTVRAPGESEPEVLKSAAKEAKSRELQFIRELLQKNNFTPAEVLGNEKLIIWAEKEFRKGQGYLFGTAEEHLKTLDRERRSNQLKIKK